MWHDDMTMRSWGMIVTAKTSSSPEALSSRHDQPLLSNGKQTIYVLPFALLMTIYNLDCTPRIWLLKIKVEASSKGVITFTVFFIMRHSFPAESMFISYHVHSWKSLLCYNIRCPLPGWLLYKIERQRSFEENILPVYGVTLLMISVPRSTEWWPV